MAEFGNLRYGMRASGYFIAHGRLNRLVPEFYAAKRNMR
jgi:hypothetical protein